MREGDFVRIDLADTGSGIPGSPSRPPRLRALLSPPKRWARASGQGLAIARSIV